MHLNVEVKPDNLKNPILFGIGLGIFLKPLANKIIKLPDANNGIVIEFIIHANYSYIFIMVVLQVCAMIFMIKK